jgi:hypothetical protein
MHGAVLLLFEYFALLADEEGAVMHVSAYIGQPYHACIAMSVLPPACMFVSALCMYVLGRASDRFMPCACCLLTQLVCYRWLG